MTADTQVEVPDFASIPDSDDPFAVVFVVNDSRDESGNIAAERDILQASGNALIQLLTSDNEQVVTAVEEWTAGRIRKIVKRARGSAWNKVESLEAVHFTGEHNEAKVLAFIPMRLSEQPKELKRLQVTGLNSTERSPSEYENEAHLLVQVNESLNMSTGKVVAQVGHAVQLFMTFGDDTEVQDWIANGSLLKVVASENISESEVAGIVVHDAGYTEVPSGSLTAAAEYRFNNGR